LKRFIRFNLICSLGGVLNVLLLWILTDIAGIYYLISNLVGIGVSTLWNYGLNSNLTWELSVVRKVHRVQQQEEIILDKSYKPDVGRIDSE